MVKEFFEELCLFSEIFEYGGVEEIVVEEGLVVY